MPAPSEVKARAYSLSDLLSTAFEERITGKLILHFFQGVPRVADWKGKRIDIDSGAKKTSYAGPPPAIQ